MRLVGILKKFYKLVKDKIYLIPEDCVSRTSFDVVAASLVTIRLKSHRTICCLVLKVSKIIIII